ncbi:hypothetical protein COCON_G00071910 [Conger conger]|uniref:Uncharacterized protein n=1 Tax=Conger conger TaxID=82655 RepID=A0A9Q1DN11_CONCO|nr:hypothetical protein COCON_G00071910 [Conger conger]
MSIRYANTTIDFGLPVRLVLAQPPWCRCAQSRSLCRSARGSVACTRSPPDVVVDAARIPALLRASQEPRSEDERSHIRASTAQHLTAWQGTSVSLSYPDNTQPTPVLIAAAEWRIQKKRTTNKR